MIVSTQKPAAEARESVGRPATGKTPIQQVRIPDDEWDGLRMAARGAHVRVLREFIRWYLRRPGAKLPVRPAVDRVDTTGAAE